MKAALFATLAVVGLAQVSMSLAATQKTAYHCVDSEGKVVDSVKSKKSCTAPNKWQKLASAKTSAVHNMK